MERCPRSPSAASLHDGDTRHLMRHKRDSVLGSGAPPVYRNSRDAPLVRTIGPPPEIVIDPSGSRRDHRAKYGCLSTRPRVRCLCPPGKDAAPPPKVSVRPPPDLASTSNSR